MSSKTGLRAVQPHETAAPAQPKTVAQAAKSGTPRELLVAMRDRIAETVSQSNCAARDLASLTKRLQDIAHDIDAIDSRGDGEAADRVRELEAALKLWAPDHPLLSGAHVIDDSFDASVI